MRSFEATTVRDSYLLEQLIGEGMFGAVFRSEQRFVGVPIRRVAVKLSKHTGLDPETARDIFADAFVLARAMDEMRDTEARRHLVHVYDLGILEDDGRGFVVMEYVHGTTLEEQFTSLTRVPAPLLVKWARQICLALRGLHTLPTPVIHRDLKPDNVLLGVDLAVRLVDFGLAAKLLAHGYVPGVAGTVAYMAPETSQGRSVPASDVYSLGLLLYRGLTGKLPFEHLAPPLDLPSSLHQEWLFEQKRALRVMPPSERSNTSTPALDAVVLRCLEFDPHDRYRDAGELLDALDLDRSAPPGEVARSEGRRLREEGDDAGARRTLEAALLERSLPVDTRFAMLRELGALMLDAGDAAGAADRLLEAWRMANGTAVLRTRAERAQLLEEVAEAYGRVGNGYQARRYRDKAAAELDGSGGRGVAGT